jgi:8-oxo-dGTP pyrophosphatase MutT (NUDIX family)
MKFKAIVDLHLFLTNSKGRVLLLRRFNTGYQDGNYSVPAGHLEANESAVEGIIREAREEIGITLLENNLKLCHVMHQMSSGSSRIGLFFEVDEWTGNPINKEPNKCDDLRWYNIDNLPVNLVLYVKQAIKYWHEGTAYSQFGWDL